MAEPAVYTTRQLAERWQVSTDFVYSLIATGVIRTLPNPHGTRRPTYRVPADAVAAFEAGETATAAAPTKRKRQAERPGFVRYFGEAGR